MKHPFVLLVLAALLGGLVCGLLLAVLGEPTGARGSAPRAAAGSDPTGVTAPALERRLEQLEARQEELILRLGRIDAAVGSEPAGGAAVGRTPGGSGGREGVGTESIERLERELDLLSRTLADSGPVPERFVTRVGEALEEIEAQKEREREEELRVARAERVEERVARWRTTLSLSPYQEDELRVIFAEEERQRATLFEERGETGDRFGMREEMRELGRATNEALARVLDAGQFERYREESPRSRFGERGREGDDAGTDTRGPRGGGGSRGRGD